MHPQHLHLKAKTNAQNDIKIKKEEGKRRCEGKKWGHDWLETGSVVDGQQVWPTGAVITSAPNIYNWRLRVVAVTFDSIQRRDGDSIRRRTHVACSPVATNGEWIPLALLLILLSALDSAVKKPPCPRPRWWYQPAHKQAKQEASVQAKARRARMRATQAS